MAQDPAFLFYFQDFLVGTDDMDNDEVGAYIRCLCHQAAKGCITEKHMMKICLRRVRNSIQQVCARRRWQLLQRSFIF